MNGGGLVKPPEPPEPVELVTPPEPVELVTPPEPVELVTPPEPGLFVTTCVAFPAASQVARPLYWLKDIALTVLPSSATWLAGICSCTQRPTAGNGPMYRWPGVPLVPYEIRSEPQY